MGFAHFRLGERIEFHGFFHPFISKREMASERKATATTSETMDYTFFVCAKLFLFIVVGLFFLSRSEKVRHIVCMLRYDALSHIFTVAIVAVIIVLVRLLTNSTYFNVPAGRQAQKSIKSTTTTTTAAAATMRKNVAKEK